MAYTPAIPQPADQKNNSQGPILNNFIAINAWMAPDHVGFNVANAGKHDKVTLPERLVAGLTTDPNEILLYSRQGAYSSVAEIALMRENTGSTYEITSGKLAAKGWTILPSGILIKWGNEQWNVGNPQTKTFIIPFGGVDGPTIGTLYNMNLSTYNGASTNYDQYITHGGFATGTQTVTYHASKRTTTATEGANAILFYYFAIGLPV